MSRIYYVFALLAGMTLIISWSGNPPDGRTGAPGDGLCSDCHSLNGGTQDGSISVAGFPSTIAPSTAYVLTITNSNPNGVAVKGGFQMTVLNSSNQKAGVMTSPSAFSTVTNAAGREYWEHNPAQNYPGNNMITWNVTWTSPTGPADESITFYAAGNIANGNGNNTGDRIVTSTGNGMLDGGAGPLMVDIVDVVDVSCANGNNGSAFADATEGMAPYDFQWSNGQAEATLTNVGAGTYTVTVTDDLGATVTASVEIDEPDPIDFNAPMITNISCNGLADGAITASATGGTGSIAYQWSNGGSGGTILNLMAGSYTVTATDANDCTNTATYMVTQPSAIEINLVTLQHESCLGQEDGAITIETIGGTGTLFSEWSNGFIGNTIEDLVPGDYSVTVTDNNSCTKTATYTVDEGGVVDVSLIEKIDVTCNGGSDGSISLSAFGGQEPYTYSWSNGDNGPDVTNLAAGNYLVTVSDNQGCEAVRFYTITQPGAITIQITVTGENLCALDSLVDLEAVPTGGTGPYTGSWSNGVDGLTNTELPAGTYTITITDAMGCSSTSSAVVTAPTPIVVSISKTNETGVDANDGTATANPTGGTPDYTYLWSNAETTQTITGLAPGTYTVTVSDANGCTKQASVQINAFGCALDVSIGADIEICEGDTITLSAVVMGETGDLTYLWSDGSNLSTYEITGGGEVCVTVTDDSGCDDIACITATELIFPLITCPVVHESAPGLNDGAIMCDSISGSIIYLWSTGDTTSGISGLAPGDYCVTMTDFNGCQAVQCFTVNAAGCALVVTSLTTDVMCAGDSTGMISINVENATLPISYSWSTGDTTATVSNLAAGDYSVTITDAAACEEQVSFTLTEPDPITITVDTIIHVSGGGDPGSILITVSGGVEPYTFVWYFLGSDISNEEDLVGIFSGLYMVDVTDANGCFANVDSIEVQQSFGLFPAPDISLIKVYPVPTQDVLIIDSETQITEVQVTGIDGRLQKRVLNPTGNKLQVGDLESGIYVLRMTDGESWFVARMVK